MLGNRPSKFGPDRFDGEREQVCGYMDEHGTLVILFSFTYIQITKKSCKSQDDLIIYRQSFFFCLLLLGAKWVMEMNSSCALKRCQLNNSKAFYVLTVFCFLRFPSKDTNFTIFIREFVVKVENLFVCLRRILILLALEFSAWNARCY